MSEIFSNNIFPSNEAKMSPTATFADIKIENQEFERLEDLYEAQTVKLAYIDQYGLSLDRSAITLAERQLIDDRLISSVGMNLDNFLTSNTHVKVQRVDDHAVQDYLNDTTINYNGIATVKGYKLDINNQDVMKAGFDQKYDNDFIVSGSEIYVLDTNGKNGLDTVAVSTSRDYTRMGRIEGADTSIWSMSFTYGEDDPKLSDINVTFSNDGAVSDHSIDSISYLYNGKLHALMLEPEGFSVKNAPNLFGRGFSKIGEELVVNDIKANKLNSSEFYSMRLGDLLSKSDLFSTTHSYLNLFANNKPDNIFEYSKEGNNKYSNNNEKISLNANDLGVSIKK